MKTLLILLITPVLSLLSGYSYAAMSITFVNPGKQGERFWDMVTETMQAAANDFDIDLEVIYAERNRVRMTELGKQVAMRQTPPDYMILVNEEQAAEAILLATADTKTKVLMLLNDFLPDQRDRVGLPGQNPNLIGAIVPDNFSAGQRMMTALLNCARQKQPPPFHMLAIGGDQLTPASIDRNNGALNVINSNPEINLDRFLYANWNKQEAKLLSSHYLQWADRNNIEPAGIWAANDPIAIGASEALTEHENVAGNSVCLVGLNWSAQGLKMVKEGSMLLTDGGHFLAGAWSMVLIHDYHSKNINGNTGPLGQVRFQMQSIDQQSVDLYLNHLGDENWNKIDFKGFALTEVAMDAYDFSLERVLNQIKK
ncbi:ABC transporter substrate-binding protein [Amphritea balenae]|uniref:Sugar ABC transporter substrate-binding protein n=1 Tax=Amphritea balenae TaxID=452629 RepID=A0A3P1ST67_9GAMM|nr:ABC transporter substrate-binding protein [Amphritea balenae]RRD00382.1 sugar ABC transporter substrate-binding protein [Amphritea balenae]GGK85918.1 sugar ABC transporter substrate-binding protein [Amphritea balenae]